jgi:hypothetical protein
MKGKAKATTLHGSAGIAAVRQVIVHGDRSIAIAAMQVAPSLRDPARPPSADRLESRGLRDGTARIRSVAMTSATGPSYLHGPLFAIKMLGLLLLLDAALTVSGARPTGPAHRAATLQTMALVRTCTPIADTSHGWTGRSPA